MHIFQSFWFDGTWQYDRENAQSHRTQLRILCWLRHMLDLENKSTVFVVCSSVAPSGCKKKPCIVPRRKYQLWMIIHITILVASCLCGWNTNDPDNNRISVVNFLRIRTVDKCASGQLKWVPRLAIMVFRQLCDQLDSCCCSNLEKHDADDCNLHPNLRLTPPVFFCYTFDHIMIWQYADENLLSTDTFPHLTLRDDFQR